MLAHEFRHFFDATYLPLCMYSMRCGADDTMAQDIVGDCFARMWELIADERDINDPRAYIYRMVHNATISTLRQETGYIPLEMAEDIAEEKIETSELDARLWTAIGQLPPRCREIFLLSKRDGLSHRKIAARLAISEKTVDNQLAKAMHRLRSSLAPYRRRGNLPSSAGNPSLLAAPLFLPFL